MNTCKTELEFFAVQMSQNKDFYKVFEESKCFKCRLFEMLFTGFSVFLDGL